MWNLFLTGVLILRGGSFRRLDDGRWLFGEQLQIFTIVKIIVLEFERRRSRSDSDSVVSDVGSADLFRPLRSWSVSFTNLGCKACHLANSLRNLKCVCTWPYPPYKPFPAHRWGQRMNWAMSMSTSHELAKAIRLQHSFSLEKTKLQKTIKIKRGDGSYLLCWPQEARKTEDGWRFANKVISCDVELICRWYYHLCAILFPQAASGCQNYTRVSRK